MPKLTARQRAYIRKHSRVEEPDPSEVVGELNIVPFLDITVNIIVVLLMLTTMIAMFMQITTRLPSKSRGGRGRAPQEQTLNLNVILTKKGIIVAGSGGKLQPGCQQVYAGQGQVITIPARRGKGGEIEYDWKALTECVALVHKQWPDEDQVTIGADPPIPFKYVVRAMDAVREDGKGNKLFPRVLLTAGYR